MGLYLQDIVDNTLNFSANFTEEGFIYELLEAYGISKANITKMRQSKEPFMLNNKVHFKVANGSGVTAALEELKACPKTKKKKSRFLIATDFTRLLAVDTKVDEVLDIAVEDFFEEYGFFLPWTGREKVQVYEEVEADQKAAQKMAKLFDIIRIDNPSTEPEAIDALNHFFTRLIFCYYAEDTGIFEKDVFTHHLEVHTDYDGSNTSSELRQIFKVLNTANNKNYTIISHTGNCIFIKNEYISKIKFDEKFIKNPSLLFDSKWIYGPFKKLKLFISNAVDKKFMLFF